LELVSEARGVEGVSTAITFKLPPQAESPFLFRRTLLNAIRLAVSDAHIAGQIDVKTAVAALAALPMPDAPK
jgi:hypothetical protein